jgi:nucleotide-binding universal stress UspA family protein
MIERVLLAVDDSPAALAAARLAIDLAKGWTATLRVVTVVADHEVAERLHSGATNRVDQRRMATASTVLHYVATLADRVGMPVETTQLDGEPAPAILEQARVWSADLIVIGRSGSAGAGQPFVGSQTRHVLEFADAPVLVVPPR